MSESRFPATVEVVITRIGVNTVDYPAWLLRVAQAWWAVLPPTRCTARCNGDEVIIDTLHRTDATDCALRLDWVECRVRFNGVIYSWMIGQAVHPEPLAGFYTEVDTERRILHNEVAVLAQVIGALSYPGKSFDETCR